MRRTASVIVGSIAAAGVLAWGVPTLAQAEETPSAPQSGPAATDGEADRRDDMRAELAARLAEELGIDADEVAAALEKIGEELRAEHQAERLATLEERLAEAVENGRLTQERADEILAAAKDGDLRGLMGRHHGGMRGFGSGGHGGPWSDEAPGSDDDSATRFDSTVWRL